MDRLVALFVVVALFTGCRALLPTSKEETVSSWRHFEQVKTAYDQITPGQSIADLQGLGFDVVNSPNVQVLSYLDVATMIQAIPLPELDPGLQACLRARDECRAYVFELRRLQSKRVGNFWSDFFNFKRKTDSTGWRFKALLVMVNDEVNYKLWSGSPIIDTYREDSNPLGPLQGSGDKVLSLF